MLITPRKKEESARGRRDLASRREEEAFLETRAEYRSVESMRRSPTIRSTELRHARSYYLVLLNNVYRVITRI